MKSIYLTTTLPYVNAEPHIGHAQELVLADVYARFNRLLGREVFFNTGTDEHGQKVLQKSQEEKKDINEYVDYYAERFKKLKSCLDLSYDSFIRTTEDRHIKAAQELWRLCDSRDDIYKKKYKGVYCVGDEAFLRPSDIVDGKCPNHPNIDLIEIEEENYFFRLSKYRNRLLEYLNQENSTIPDWRRQEAIKFVEDGLEDISISRDKSKLSWGIPVPNDDAQVMYVWFDALVNYISTLGWPNDESKNFKKFWQEGETVQFAGKDQVRFQSIIWQAMLMSADIKTTSKIVYHGFIQSGGQKMSKSLGNVVDPTVLVSEYGTDALRYFLIRELQTFEDGDYTSERFKETYNAHLANGLGNVSGRIMKMAEDNLGQVPEIPKQSIPPAFFGLLEKFEFQKAADLVWNKIGELDKKIDETKPFILIKTEPEKAKIIIGELVVGLYTVARMLNPLLPQTSAKIKQAIKENKKPDSLFVRK